MNYDRIASPQKNVHTTPKKPQYFTSRAQITYTLQKNIYCAPQGNHPLKKHDSPAGLRGSISKTKVFRDLGPKPPIPLAFGSPSHATAAQCAEEGGSAG